MSSTSDIRHSNAIPSQEPPNDGPRLVTPLGHRPNAHFVGFQDELRRLHKRLQHDGHRDAGSRAVLVWGEVGSGKTHLTRQYFYKHRHEYPEGSFWVDCKTSETMTKCLWDIGVSIGALEQERDRRTVAPGPDNFADAVRQSLESLQGWLLVFDGVLFESEESLDAFRKYVPDRNGNCIIFTSVDRTLSHRHRLLNPAPLKIGKLAVSDAVDLLYKNLGIRQPTKIQAQKALDLVKDHDHLPLGIHAAAHALIEHGKALERYTHISTDLRLITPFLDIVSALRNQGRDEAVNLVNLLSFFNHQVPVALVRFGLKGLSQPQYEVDILSPKYANSTRTDLDSSISILMRSGLLERTLQTWSRSSGSSSPEESRSLRRGDVAPRTNGSRSIVVRALEDTPPGLTADELSGNSVPVTRTIASRSIVNRAIENTPPAQLAEESSGLDEMILTRFESRGTRASGASSQSVVDTLRIHTVVQNVIRDDLKERPLIGEHDYWWWLGAAVSLLSRSYTVACERMRSATGAGLVRDYREYEAQAARLLSHFPKTSLNASMDLRRARHEVRTLLKMAKREIQNRSPTHTSQSSGRISSASDGRRLYQESVFERSSITSEEDQSPTTSSPSRTSTWSYEPERPPSESPTQMHAQIGTGAGPLGLGNGLTIDTRPSVASYLDAEGGVVSTRDPSAEAGFVELDSAILSDDGSWSNTTEVPNHALLPRSRTSSVLHAVLEGKPNLRPHKDLGEWKALPAPPSISQPDVLPHSSRTSSETRSSRPSSSSGAEAALAAMHRSSPPASRGSGRLRSTSRGSMDYIRPALAVKSPNTTLSPLASDYVPSGVSKIGSPATLPLRNPSSSPRLKQALLNSQANSIRPELSPLLVENISVAHAAGRNERGPSSVGQPQTLVESPVPVVRYLPSGYRSMPMSRDPSRESDNIVATSMAGSAPQRTFSDPYVLGVDAPGTYGFSLDDPRAYTGDFQHRGRHNPGHDRVEGWAHLPPNGSAHASFGNNTSGEDLATMHYEALQFGNMEPVSIDEARARADIARARSIDSSARGRSRGGRSNNHSERSH